MACYRYKTHSAFFFLMLIFLLIPARNRNRNSVKPSECCWPCKEQKAACKHLVNASDMFSAQERSKKSNKDEMRKKHMRSWCDQYFVFCFVVNENLSAGLQWISEAIFFFVGLLQLNLSSSWQTPEQGFILIVLCHKLEVSQTHSEKYLSSTGGIRNTSKTKPKMS